MRWTDRYLRMDFASATELHMQFVSDEDGSIVDDFHVKRISS